LTRGRWALSCGLVAICVGCGLEQLHRPLALSADTRSLVLVFYQHSALVAVAQEVEAGVASIPQILADEGSAVAALEYPDPLVRLSVEPGRLILAPEGEPLPAPVRVWSLASVGGSTAWEPAAEVPAIAGRIRVSTCCQRQYAPLRLRCSYSCPSVTRPAPPGQPQPGSMPERPRLSAGLCSSTWEPRGQGSLQWCVPPSVVACGLGQRQGLDAPGCLALHSCADLGPVPADALWVTPGGAGDGSRLRPFGTVASALLAGRPGQTIALVGEGRLPPFTVDRSVVLRGLCDGRLSIDADAQGVAVRIATPGPAALVGFTARGVLVAASDSELTLEGVTLGGLQLDEGANARITESTLLGAAVVAGTLVGDDLASTSSGSAPNFSLTGPARLSLRRARVTQGGRGPILLASGLGQATLEHVWMEGRGRGLELRAGAELELVGVGGTGLGIDLSGGAHLRAAEVYLALESSGIAVASAELQLRDAILTQTPAAGAAALVVRASTVSFARVGVGALARGLLVAVTSSISLGDLLVDSSSVAGSGELSVQGGALRVERFALRGGGGVECSQGAQLNLQSGELRGLVRLGNCRLRGAWLYIEGTLEARSLEGAALLTLDDVELHSYLPNETVVSVDGVRTQINRALLGGDFARGLAIQGGAQVQVSDLEVISPPQAQGLSVASGASVSGARLRIRGGQTAMEVVKSQLVVSDLEVSGAQTGLRANSSPLQLQVQRLFAHGNTGAGLSLAGLPGDATLSDVELRANGVGLELAGDLRQVGVLDSALLLGNEEAVKVCLEWPCPP